MIMTITKEHFDALTNGLFLLFYLLF